MTPDQIPGSKAIPIPGVTNILAVASGKGGVGKTTVAVNLALAIAQAGKSVGLFDADLYGPNVPLMLGVHRTQPGGGYVPVARRDSMPYISPLTRFGIKAMSIGFLLGERDTVLPDARFAGHIIRQTMRDVKWGQLDILLVDFPPGSGEPQQSLFQTIPFKGAIIVTTPQDLSLLDVGRSLGLFHKLEVPILGVVENMSFLICPHCGEQVEVFHRSERKWVVEEETLQLLGRVPMDIAISRGISKGHPLMQDGPNSIQAAAFREIALKITQKLNSNEA